MKKRMVTMLLGGLFLVAACEPFPSEPDFSQSRWYFVHIFLKSKIEIDLDVCIEGCDASEMRVTNKNGINADVRILKLTTDENWEHTWNLLFEKTLVPWEKHYERKLAVEFADIILMQTRVNDKFYQQVYEIGSE